LVRDDLRRALWSEPGREMMKDPMKKSMKWWWNDVKKERSHRFPLPKLRWRISKLIHIQFSTFAFVTCFDVSKKISSVSEVAKKSLNVVPHWCDVFLSGHLWVVRGRRDVGMVQNVAQNGWFRHVSTLEMAFLFCWLIIGRYS
jgi:hypothetical protein